MAHRDVEQAGRRFRVRRFHYVATDLGLLRLLRLLLLLLQAASKARSIPEGDNARFNQTFLGRLAQRFPFRLEEEEW